MIFECSFECRLFINFFEQFLPPKNPKILLLACFLKLKVRVAKQRQRIYT